MIETQWGERYGSNRRNRGNVAMMTLLADGGVDRLFERRLFGRLRAHGLVSISGEARTFMWQRGSPGAALVRATYELLRGALIDGNYITEEQFEKDVARLDDPDFLVPSAILWSASGRRPLDVLCAE